MVKLILKLILYLIIIFLGAPCVVYARMFPEYYAKPSWWAVVVVGINFFWLVFLGYVFWLVVN